MTILEMHLAIRLNLDKSTALVGSVDFLPEELDFWLNEAQGRYIEQRLYSNNYRKEGFEGSVKRIDDLSSLVCNSGQLVLSSNSNTSSNIKEATLPKDDAINPYLHYINSTLYDSLGNALQTGDIIKHSDISNFMKDVINNPWIRRPLVFFYKGNDSDNTTKIAFIYSDEFIPVNCDITYIKKPKQLTSFTVTGYQTQTCELPEYTHREIVNLAVSMLIENIESPRVQTFEQLNASKVE